MDIKFKFLEAVLGTDGAKALKKAAERHAVLGEALVPRTILAWINTAARIEYEGEIPGVSNTYVEFKKNESAYDGHIAIADEVYAFEKATLYHVAASVAVALGVDTLTVSDDLRDLDLAKLGKSIDLLAKARIVTKDLDLEKVDHPPGPAAAPIAPAGGEAPVAPTPTQAKTNPKPPTPTTGAPKPVKAAKQAGTGSGSAKAKSKLPSLKVTKSEMTSACKVCNGKQFTGAAFTGCVCFGLLAKHTKVTPTPDGCRIEFEDEWDSEGILALVESLK